MCIPGLIVAKIDLHQIDSQLNQVTCHQERPAEAVVTITLELFGVRLGKIKSIMGLTISQK